MSGASPGLHPVATVARIMDVSERRVQVLARDGIIPKAKHGQYDLIACVQSYIRHLRGVAAGHTSQDGKLDLTEERARLAKEQADAQEMKNRQTRAELIPASDQEAALIALASSVQRRVLGVPTKVAPLVALETEAQVCESIVREHIEDALHELADAEIAVRGGGSALDDGAEPSSGAGRDASSAAADDQ